MAPPQQSKAKAKPAVTARTKPARVEVKVSVLNIRGPFTAEIIRAADAQTKSTVPVQRPEPSVSQAAGRPASSDLQSKESQTPTITIGSRPKEDSVTRRTGSSTQHLIGHSPGLRPLCLAGVSGCALKECLIIRSMQHHLQRKT